VTLSRTTCSPEETELIGRRLSTCLSRGDVVALEGPLGAGKTVMVRGIARGLGFEGPVTSPTFTIIHVFEDVELCHVDAFRLSSGDDLDEAGFEEYLDGSWICAVEWADVVADVLPPGALTIRIEMGNAGDERLVSVIAPERSAPRIATALEDPA
jgi:tRNA threonylcarbamoyladenosine biosynthesis protein TsaE